jgi:uridine kinase
MADTRAQLINELASIIASQRTDHPLRVAINGVDAAGKTTLADELVKPLAGLGVPVIRASIDDFQRPAGERHRRGRDSPEGYYFDSFNHEALIKELLQPLGGGGDRTYRTQLFDYRANTAVDSVKKTAPGDAVLLFDGVFLLRPELNEYWDFRIFLHVPFTETLARAKVRDQAAMGGPAGVEAKYTKKYIPGQQLYLDAVQPEQLADIIIDNTNYDAPDLSSR